MLSNQLLYPRPQERSRQRLILRDAAQAFYCQMYYWGRDVRHPEGSLLERIGFERIPRTTVEGTSRYRLSYEGGVLELHGFCAGWYGPEGGICFDRKMETWRLWEGPGFPEPTALDRAHSFPQASADDLQRTVKETARLFRWMAWYERQALSWWGMKERKSHYRDFTKLRPCRWWLPPSASLLWLDAYAADPISVLRPRAFLRGEG